MVPRHVMRASDPPWPPSPCADGTCPVSRAVAVLDGKWTVLVVRELLGGRRRFGALQDALAGVSPKTLTDRLRSLEGAGLVTRTTYAEVPPRVEYELTELGRSLEPVLLALATFGLSLADVAAGAGQPGRSRSSSAKRR